VSGWVASLGVWIELHPGSASWVQAIGATLAVIAAVLVPALQARHARLQREADRSLRAKSLAIAIYPELLHVRLAHRHTRRRMQDLIARKQRDCATAIPELSSTDLADEETRLLIPITEALRAMVANFYLLGEPIGPQVQKCIGRSMKYNDVLNSLRGSDFGIELPALLAFLENGLAQVEACIAGIEQAWNISADMADPFVDHLAGPVAPVMPLERETRSKETV
jgi:hypothetical protein